MQHDSKHPVFGISKPIKIASVVTIVLALTIITLNERYRREKAEAAKIAATNHQQKEAANRKQAEADWHTKRQELDRQNVIAARQRDEDYRIAQHSASIAKIKEVTTRFYDLTRVADSAPSLALAGLIPQLQAIHRETLRLQVSECMTAGQTALATAFSESINTQLARMQNNIQGVLKHNQNTQAALDDFNRIKVQCE